jgi:hypothetical protein
LGVQAFRSAAQQHRIARLQAQCGGIRADIRPALVDHADHADRRRDAADMQPVRLRPVGQRAAERIGQSGDILDALRHRRDARLGQRQAVTECRGGRTLRHIDRIGGQDRRRGVTNGCRHRDQRGVALAFAAARQHPRRLPCGQRRALQVLGRLAVDMHRHALPAASVPRHRSRANVVTTAPGRRDG